MENNDDKIYKEGDIIECKRCNGKGEFVTGFDSSGNPYPCNYSKKIKCPRCHGTGFVRVSAS